MNAKLLRYFARMAAYAVLAIGVIALAVWGAVRFTLSREETADRFYATTAAAVAASTPQSVFGKGETPAIVVQGAAFEGRELRVIVRGEDAAKPPHTSNAVRLAGGKFHAWTLPQIAPGNYRVQLLIDGRADRELLITVRK